MERSLSILLPVQNAQASLQRSVARLLETAAELTERFEILIVDDGSTDHTEEVALEMAAQYPQIGVVRHASPRGLTDVIRQGLARTTGEIVCLHEGDGEVDVADLRQLWRRREEPDLVLARHDRQAAKGKSAAERDAANSKPSGSGFHMLRRDALEALRDGAALAANHQEVRVDCGGRSTPGIPVKRPNFLAKLRDLTWGE